MSASLAEGKNTVHARERGRPVTRTPAGDAFAQFAITVIRLSGLLIAAGDALTSPVGQTSARWLVLATVDEGPRTVAQIARQLGLARQSVQRVADLLADDGLVAYAENPAHRRAKLVKLTPPGKKTLKAIQAAQTIWADNLGAQLGVGSLEEANSVLSRALDELSQRRFEAKGQVSAKPG
jgi:DNA-binding MarR family transcriptional regulator